MGYYIDEEKNKTVIGTGFELNNRWVCKGRD